MLTIREIKSLLGWYADMGMDEIIAPEPRQWNAQPAPKADSATLTAIEAPRRATPRQPAAPTSPAAHEAEAVARSLADKAQSFDALKEAIEGFDGCDLKKMAKHTVFADGVRSAPVMLIGEAPGADEDRMGIPFCGVSGKLQDEMLAAIGLSRDSNLYISNTLFWRPPGNRTPTPEEIAICLPFVEKHIALCAPKLLILSGATAMKALLNQQQSISRMIGQQLTYTNRYLTAPIPTRVIYHPSFLLRQPLQKRDAWADLLDIANQLKSIIT